MQPVATDFEVTSTLNGENVNLSLDQDSLVHIMSQFIDLYTDAEAAVIRELATNALDSHVEAGNPNPIEVTTPSNLSPVFRVKDYGTGLSRDDIRNIYSKYGASTKRDSNDAVGMLGFGCKSPLTYTHQFTLISVKDGEKFVCIISRDENGIASINIQDSIDTDEPNGVEIIVPTKFANSFEHKSEEFFKYWPEGSVLVNGKQPKSFNYMLKVTDDIYVVNDGDKYSKSCTAVMGNVPYPVESEYINSLNISYGQGLVIFFDIGELQFAPSREGLRYTKLTKESLNAKFSIYKTELLKSIQNNLNSVNTAREAIDIIQEADGLGISYTKLSWKGKPVPSRVDLGSYAYTTSVIKRQGYNWNSHNTQNNLVLQDLSKTIFVKDWNQGGFTATTKKKLVAWTDDNTDNLPYNNNSRYACKYGDRVVNQFALMSGPIPVSDWIDDDQIIDYQTDIKLIKLNSTMGSGSRSKTNDKYACFDPVATYSTELSAIEIKDLIKNGIPVFYANYHKDQWFTNEKKILNTVHTDYRIVELPGNRLNKFQRLVPGVPYIKHELTRIAQNYMKNLGTDYVRYHSLINDHNSLYNVVFKLYKKNIALIDPEVNELIDLVRTMEKISIPDQLDLMKCYATLPSSSNISIKNYIKHRYPLLLDVYHISSSHTDHLKLYMDAAYNHHLNNVSTSATIQPTTI